MTFSPSQSASTQIALTKFTYLITSFDLYLPSCTLLIWQNAPLNANPVILWFPEAHTHRRLKEGLYDNFSRAKERETQSVCPMNTNHRHTTQLCYILCWRKTVIKVMPIPISPYRQSNCNFLKIIFPFVLQTVHLWSKVIPLISLLGYLTWS